MRCDKGGRVENDTLLVILLWTKISFIVIFTQNRRICYTRLIQSCCQSDAFDSPVKEVGYWEECIFVGISVKFYYLSYLTRENQ